VLEGVTHGGTPWS